MNPYKNPYHKTQFAQKNPLLITGLFPRLFCKKSCKNAGIHFRDNQNIFTYELTTTLPASVKKRRNQLKFEK